jgi:hypothetical protein
MSSRTFSSSDASTDKQWSLPVQITGDAGAPGKDGSVTEFIYCLDDNKPSVENLEGAGQEITSNVTSQYLKDYILNMSAEVPEDVIIPDDQPEEFPDGNDNEVLDQ